MSTEGQTRIYEMVTERIVKALQGGTVPWRKPWKDGGLGGYPFSMSTRKPYRGANIFLLGLSAMANGYTSPWWGSFKRIKELGGTVKKGEHGEFVIFWKTGTKREYDEDLGKEVNKKFFMLRYYKVWNADQCDGLPERFYPKPVERDPFEVREQAQKLFDSYLEREHIPLDWDVRAFYVPATDRMALPKPETFDTPEDYYATAFHEAGHSTGHKSRLNREGTAQFDHFGSERYSREELVAEFTAAMLEAVTGVSTPAVQENEAAYIKSWLRKLQDDPKLAVKAAGQAQRAADYIQGIEFTNDDEGES